jgi:uncharacterized protein (TIGR02217 family)
VSFKNIRFPVDISFDAVGGPGFLTNVVPTNSGKEFREDVWALERGEWEVSHAADLPDKYQRLQAFFRAVKGRAYSFRFKDWTDFIAASGEGLFLDTGDDSPATSKQMVKRYTFDGETFDRFITKPISGKVTTDAVSLDYNTGIATSGTVWSGEFDCHARFDTDKMKAVTKDRNPSKGLIITWASIPIIEIK